MSPDKLLRHIVARALSGEGAHAGTASAFEGLDWKVAAMRLDGKDPKVPRHAAGSWPGKPTPGSRQEWQRGVRDFRADRTLLEKRAREEDLLGKIGRTTRLQMLHAIASHNSYHIGQVVVLRQLLGKWPPRSGAGLTW
jgi:hypothetical protein